MSTVIQFPDECLWPNQLAQKKIQAFDKLNTISLTVKKFDFAGGKIAQRSISEHNRLGIATEVSERLGWLYEAEVRYIVQTLLGKSAPNGLDTFNNNELDTIAQFIASRPFEVIVTDYEGYEGWIWPSYRNTAKISYISQKVKQLTLNGTSYKKYTDLFQKSRFTFNGKSLEAKPDGHTWQVGDRSVDDYIAYYANPSAATAIEDTTVLATAGYGYGSIVFKPDNAAGSAYPANLHYGGIPNYLNSLCNINSHIANDMSRKIAYFVWAREDQTRLQNQNIRYKPSSINGDLNPVGYVRITDSRLTYPPNLIRDNITYATLHPNVQHVHSWILPNSEDPYDIFRWVRRNGQVSCGDNLNGSSLLGFEVGNYIGNDVDSLPCPSTNRDYIGDERIQYNAILQGLNRAVPHQDICDNTQVGSCPAFEYKRSWESSFTSVSAVNDLSEFARAYKFKRPFVKLWTNPTTQKKILLYQDMFEECFQTHTVRIVVNGIQRTFTVEGNELLVVRFD